MTHETAWPPEQKVERWVEPTVVVTAFDDVADYHPALTRYILEHCEQDPAAKAWNSTVGGAKLYNLEQWDCPEAALINARALALFRQVMETPDAVVDISWSTIYRDGDYCAPHSHIRATASLVYFLQLGEDDNPEAPNGRFCFADPRMAVCCRNKEGFMTTPSAPHVREGSLIMFPGQLVHFVTPYKSDKPRITLSWNINKTAIAGTPIPDMPER